MNTTGPIQGAGPLAQAMATSSSGMRAQSLRLRLAAENIANAESTATVPGGDPYRRKLVTFREAIDRNTGASVIQPGSFGRDQRGFRLSYDPSHPAADARGYVKMPNVDTLIEQADMREAGRSYEANLAALDRARTMRSKILDILKA